MAEPTLPVSLGIAFAMHCDTNGLSSDQVEELAEQVQEAIGDAAESCVELLRELGDDGG